MFHDIVRELGPLPDGISHVDFRFGTDSEGTPAVWITLMASDDLKPSKEKISDLQRLTREIHAKILQTGSSRWPYIEVATE